ncbi:MAG TPA: hypothetical protein VIT38_17375 [Allosphingosinicella sp.]|jgi:hypothetical protein
MRTRRQLNRRSFLSAVSAGAVTGGAFALIGGPVRAQTGTYTGITDSDSGSHADSGGYGRGPGGNAYGQPAQPQLGQTGYSDSDGGPNADPSGAGRRGRAPARSGHTDSDPSDPSGQGRGVIRANQRRPDGTCVHHTGRTDSDSGAVRDPSGYGNGGSPGSNRLPPQHCQ